MDKSKKSSGKKNKVVSSNQSAAKGRDVTDSLNARNQTVQNAPGATSSSVEAPDRLKDEAELNRLRQENKELTELKRRHEAEISALRRSEANSREMISSVMGVSQSSGGKCISVINRMQHFNFRHYCGANFLQKNVHV